MRDAKDDIKSDIKRTLFIEKKTKGHFPIYRSNVFEKIGIKNYYQLYYKNRRNFKIFKGSW